MIPASYIRTRISTMAMCMCMRVGVWVAHGSGD